MGTQVLTTIWYLLLVSKVYSNSNNIFLSLAQLGTYTIRYPYIFNHYLDED